MKFPLKATLVILATSCMTLTQLPAQAHDMHAESLPSAMPAVALNDTDANKLIDIMRDNLKKMDAQLDRVRSAKDTAARDKALQEYALTQSENMRLGHGIGTHPMMPCAGMMEHGGMMEYDGMARGGMGHCMTMGQGKMAGPDARIEHLEQRMDLMQKRLDQLKKTKPSAAK